MCQLCTYDFTKACPGFRALAESVADGHEIQRLAQEKVRLARQNRQLLALNERLLDEEAEVAASMVNVVGSTVPSGIGVERWALLERIAMYMHHGDSRRGTLDMQQLRSLDRTLPPRPEA